MSQENNIYENVNRVKSILVGVSTGTSYKEPGLQYEYEQLRSKLISDQQIKSLLPSFVISCRQLNEFWGYIQPKFGGYAERRSFLSDEFNSLLSAIESNSLGSPTDSSIGDTLKNLDSNEVNTIWQKAISRKVIDPEGALTMARTLLEATIKHILDDLSVEYRDGDELPRLYKNMASKLNLAPNEQTEQIFKQLLSGCHNVVEGIGALRNKLSDAHGRGRENLEIPSRHIELGVNMAGVLATFWVNTYKDLSSEGKI